jgi:hypothetical protein
MSVSAFGVEHITKADKADKRDVAGYAAAGTLGAGGVTGVARARDHMKGASYWNGLARKQELVHPTDRVYSKTPRELHAHSWEMRQKSLRAGRTGKAALAAGALTFGATVAHQRKQVRKSAFGVEHGYPVVKRNTNKDTASWERMATGAVFPGTHGVIAGRKGKKLRAAGHELVGAGVGSMLPGPGTIAGGVIGTNMAHQKGYYKQDEGTQRKKKHHHHHPARKDHS